jgi:outer membrane receptor protein involved in Fe transport
MRRIIFFLFVLFLLAPVGASMPPANVEGRVYDSLSMEPLVGATIIYHKGMVASTDAHGYYKLWMPEGQHTIVFQYVGYQTVRKDLFVNENQPRILNVGMLPSVTEIDQVVVSAGRLPQRVAESTVSVSLIRPERLSAGHLTNAQDIIDKASGIEVLDGQASIRGGSGFSYGAGSRVLVLTDGLPSMSTDAGSVRWNTLPLENISQIEIIKGASSVLYGSAALNGIVNLRTATPGKEGKTAFFLEGGVFGRPKNRNWMWWDSPRTFTSASFFHSRQYGNTGLSIGSFVMLDQGYRKLDDEKLGRINLKLNRPHKRIEGLSYGVGIQGGVTEKRDFILWEDAHIGALKQDPSTASRMQGRYLFIDPYVSLQARDVFTHDIRMRMQLSENEHPDFQQNSSSTLSLYSEYQGWFSIFERMSLNAGLSQLLNRVRSNFYGDHEGVNMAVFLQANLHPTDRLTMVAGLRIEHNALNGINDRLQPLFRAGANYRIMDATFLRASFGQGYRYPSIAEKYATTTLGAVRVVPSPNVKPESGWNAELGVKQGWLSTRVDGLIDLALFYGQNSDMIEYIFILTHDQQTNEFYPAFRATNIEHSRVYGAEIEFILNNQWYRFKNTFTGGYVFMIPVEFDPFTNKNTGDYLKFRRKHAAVLGFSTTYKRISAGLNLYVRSPILAIDDIFTNPATREQILPGFYDYWLRKNTTYFLADANMAYRLNNYLSLSLALNNISNTEYMGRPGDIRPHRHVSIRLSGNL